MPQAATPSNIVPFAFKDQLVRAMERDGEPWFVGRDVCRVLDIKNESHALGRLDDDERRDGVAINDPIGREQTVIIVSEPGVFRLIFTSRKPEAEEFKRWLAHEVLPALRRHGFYGVAPSESGPNSGAGLALLAGATFRDRVECCRLASRLAGRERALVLWAALDLPPIPPPPPNGQEMLLHEARQCLAQLLAWKSESQPDITIREAIEAALEDDSMNQLFLRSVGIRVNDGYATHFVVANSGKQLEKAFMGTDWAKGRWGPTLRRLPGATPAPPMRYSGEQRRGTFIPVEYLDGD